MGVEKEKQYASPADAKYVTVVKPLDLLLYPYMTFN